jgi:hypothetical protein
MPDKSLHGFHAYPLVKAVNIEALKDVISCLPALESIPFIGEISNDFFPAALNPSYPCWSTLTLNVSIPAFVDSALLMNPDFTNRVLFERHTVYSMQDVHVLRPNVIGYGGEDSALRLKTLIVFPNEAGCAAFAEFSLAYVEKIQVDFGLTRNEDSSTIQALMQTLQIYSHSKQGSLLNRITFGTHDLSSLEKDSRRYIPFLSFLFDECHHARQKEFGPVGIHSIELTRDKDFNAERSLEGAGDGWASWEIIGLEFWDHSWDVQVWPTFAMKVPHVRTLTIHTGMILDTQYNFANRYLHSKDRSLLTYGGYTDRTYSSTPFLA